MRPVPDIETSSAKKAGIDGPRARAEQCQTRSDNRQQEVSRKIGLGGMPRESDPAFSRCHQCSGDGRPQTGEKKESGGGRGQIQADCR